MRFVVVGAGAVGGVVGARLIQSGHGVALVARGAHGDAIAANGLRVHSPMGEDRVHGDVFASVEAADVDGDDIVLLAVKSQDTVAVLDELRAHCPTDLPVVCLQNGVYNEREALRRFERVYGATVMCPTAHLEPGHVVAYSAPITGIVDVGRYPQGTDTIATTVSEALSASTFSSFAQPNIERWKWAKLVTKLGNAIEAVCGPPARQGPIGDIVRDEATAVLDAVGIEYASTQEDRERRADHLQRQPVSGVDRPGGSTWQSLARRSGTVETDYLNGEIVMLGRQHGIPAPANKALQSHANALALSGGEPGTISEVTFLNSLP